MKQVVIRASQSDLGQVDFYSYLPEGQVKENGGCSTPVIHRIRLDKSLFVKMIRNGIHSHIDHLVRITFWPIT